MFTESNISIYKKRIISISLLGSILSLALTSLRLNDNVGVGELIIVLSFFYYMLHIKKINRSGEFSNPNKFIFSFFVLLLCGFIYTSFFIKELHTEEYFTNAIRTFIAYLFSIANAFLLCQIINSERDFLYLIKSIILYFNLVIGVSFLLLFPQFIESIFSPIRFYGFSKNPNQLASLGIVVPFLIFYLRQNKDISFYYTLFSIIIVILLAVVVKSDALFYALIFSGCAYTLLNFKNLKFEKKVFFFFIIIYIFFNYIYEALFSYVLKTNTEGDQSDVRYLLWNNALEGLLHSPILGFGPGSFSGLTGPFEGAESHNTFIDLFTNVGLIGLLLFLFFLYRIFFKLYILNENFLLLTLLSITIFSVFHNILRHPLYWIVVFSLYTFSHRNKNKTNVGINYNSSL
jgi:O-antigen ligase